MAVNAHTRESKTATVEQLTSEIEELTASMAKLTEEITELTLQVSELDAAVAKATEIRAEEKQKNTATIKDAQEGAEAVGEALKILKDFYAKAAKSKAFIQEEPV